MDNFSLFYSILCGHTHHFVILYVISCQFSTQLIQRSEHNRRMSCRRLFLRTKNVLIVSAASSEKIKYSIGRKHSAPHHTLCDGVMCFVSRSTDVRIMIRTCSLLAHWYWCIICVFTCTIASTIFKYTYDSKWIQAKCVCFHIFVSALIFIIFISWCCSLHQKCHISFAFSRSLPYTFSDSVFYKLWLKQWTRRKIAAELP